MHGTLAVTNKSNLFETVRAYNCIFCAVISAGILWIFLVELLGEAPHPLYSATSLAEIFLASLVMLFFSLQNSIVHLLSCVFISLFYTLRVLVTYFAPQHLEYSEYQSYTQANIELATRYFMLFSMVLLLVSVVHAFLYPAAKFNSRNAARPIEVSEKISFFGVRVDFRSFLLAALIFTVIAALFKVVALASDFGIRTQQVYDPSMYLLRVAQSLSFPFYLLSMFALCLSSYKNYAAMKSLSIIIIGLIIVDGILATSRGWVFALIASYVICACVLNLSISRRTQVLFFVLILAGLLVVFPAMTLLRPLMLAREYFTLAEYLDLFMNNITSVAILNIAQTSLDRFAGFDWLVLWVNVDPANIPPNASLWGEVADLINRFVPGEIITIPGSQQLHKLQAILGGYRHVIEDLDELGGHGEVTGGVAAFLIFFGPVSGLLAAAAWLFALLRFERSSVHALHKVYIYKVYIQVFVVGGSWVLMPASFFWYLIVSLLIALTVRFISPYVAPAMRARRAN